MNKAVDWSVAALAEPVGDYEQLWGRVAEIRALLVAIDAGELLGDLPQAPDARIRHTAGICLLAVMERELQALLDMLEAEPR